MRRPAKQPFSDRATAILALPLPHNTRILHAAQTVLKIGAWTYDIGAFCYALRSDRRRRPGRATQVALDSFLGQRPQQIRAMIRALSSICGGDGDGSAMAQVSMTCLKAFLDFADSAGMHDCLQGGEPTRLAFLAFAEDTRERYRRQDFGAIRHNQRLRYVRSLLEAATGVENLSAGVGAVKRARTGSAGTLPLSPEAFAHAVAINHALFDGLCDLVLNGAPFPYKLPMPTSLGWQESHLWIFPTQQWRQFPHQRHLQARRANACRAYDYANGCLSKPSDIANFYRADDAESALGIAKDAIRRAQVRIEEANLDLRDRYRLMLAMIAHNAFLFLFYCNTAANEAVARDLETDGRVSERTANQSFRGIKFRAGGKQITLHAPATFMPYLRRFMELRRYLLNGAQFPYLFFTLGIGHASPPTRVTAGASLTSLVTSVLRGIDPQLPTLSPRILRASVADWYQRNHDAAITAKVLQNSEKTVARNYDAGSPTEHREEMSQFLSAVSTAARNQIVVGTKTEGCRPLEEGGHCTDFGHASPLVEHAPVPPDCKNTQGCLFCEHRVLVAEGEEVRKIASAAFVMEQLILGEQHERLLRPLINKCDEDLKRIAAFGDCSAMVESIRNDVFENHNLTPYFSDKYQLFLELGVVV